jgi:hypothetical protein
MKKKENRRTVLRRYSAQGYTAPVRPAGQNGPAGPSRARRHTRA